MKLSLISPAKSLNKAYLKQSLHRNQIESFKTNLGRLFDRINEDESEEHLKNIVSDFLKDTFYKETNEINTKNNEDLVIHNGKASSDTVGVIIEAKRPVNKAEMISKNEGNVKAFHELVLYYLKETVDEQNHEIKHLIATNIWEWFIFDAVWFEKNIFRNSKLIKDYESWKVSKHDTKYFYEHIAAKNIEKIEEKIPCAYFNLKEFEDTILNEKKEDDSSLINLYKILSPEHLLKKPFANDSNSLNKEFYSELLHIIGLTETKSGSKKTIERKSESERNEGSLLENTINILKVRERLKKIETIGQYEETEAEQLFSVALELCITWLNRILFLKLLEGQLVKYHRGDTSHAFLNVKRIADFDELNELFFEVLAVPISERTKSAKDKFGELPYLNSSLFEETKLESDAILISALKGREEIPLYTHTVLKDSKGKRIGGAEKTLKYLFEFLDAYDFASDSSEGIQEENKSIINASVLGLIFEKINGYKDGSYFTPGFITMYMCRETIRKAVLQKFRETNLSSLKDISNFEDLKDKIDYTDKVQRQKANEVINSLKICDPAVGSGHFLVSALNEILAVKSELQILSYYDDSRIKGWKVVIENDELIITNEEDDSLFEYRLNANDKPIDELQKLQEALFHEKQTLIENCLFGVDINPKSVMICRLRLWIELLKNAYYTEKSKYKHLETLPNIDINIKCGNSLISRYDVNADLSEVFKKDTNLLGQYSIAVSSYKNSTSKEKKSDLQKFITSVKEKINSFFSQHDPLNAKLSKLKGQLILVENKVAMGNLFEKLTEKDIETDVKKLKTQIERIEQEIEEAKNNKLYENAFEWRFEFPEVLNIDGKFTGFDLVIGNPPWGAEIDKKKLHFIKNENQSIIARMIDSFMFFVNKSFALKSKNGLISMIVPDVILYQVDNSKLRKKILDTVHLAQVINLGDNVFIDVARASTIIILTSSKSNHTFVGNYRTKSSSTIYEIKLDKIQTSLYLNLPYFIFPTENIEGYDLLTRIGKHKLSDYIDEDDIQRGVSPDLKDAFVIDDSIVKQYSLEKVKIKKTATGGNDIKRYHIVDKNKRLIYTSSKDNPKNIPNICKYIKQYEKEITCKEVIEGKHPFFALHRERDAKIFDKEEKILGVITGDSVITAIDNNQLYVTDGLYVFNANKNTYNKFLVAVLNSKLATYLYRLYSFEEGRVLAQIKPTILKDIPIPLVSQKEQKKFVEQVEKIESAFLRNENADISSMEKKIDEMVYEIYGLTEEEIRVVEGE